MGKKQLDIWQWMIEELEYKNEDIWEDRKIFDLNDDEQYEMKKNFKEFLQDKQALVYDLQEEISEWEEAINQKLLYLKFVNEFGFENVNFLDYIKVNLHNDLWVLFAPSGYWNSAKNIGKIQSLSEKHKDNAIRFIKRLKKEVMDDIKISYKEDTESDKAIVKIIKKTIIPLIDKKEAELKKFNNSIYF